MGIKVAYNDEFDREHYPIKDHQLKAVNAIAEFFGIDDSQSWVYFATIHGVIFEVKFTEEFLQIKHGRSRLGKEEFEFLESLGNFRWVEALGEEMKFALTHQEGEAKNV